MLLDVLARCACAHRAARPLRARRFVCVFEVECAAPDITTILNSESCQCESDLACAHWRTGLRLLCSVHSLARSLARGIRSIEGGPLARS